MNMIYTCLLQLSTKNVDLFITFIQRCKFIVDFLLKTVKVSSNTVYPFFTANPRKFETSIIMDYTVCYVLCFEGLIFATFKLSKRSIFATF
jgi:hypothetical protein